MSDADVHYVQGLLKRRPLKTLDWATPAEVYYNRSFIGLDVPKELPMLADEILLSNGDEVADQEVECDRG